jgi:hypothetical protein
MNKEAEFAIQRMASNPPPRTKSDFVRLMLPTIQDALRVGHTIKAIWECLRIQNPSLGYKEFCVYIRRIQKRAAGMRTAPPPGTKAQAEVGKQRKADFDPLKNLKRVEANRPGFQYQGTEDLQELIHGRKDHHEEQKRRNR